MANRVLIEALDQAIAYWRAELACATGHQAELIQATIRTGEALQRVLACSPVPSPVAPQKGDDDHH